MIRQNITIRTSKILKISSFILIISLFTSLLFQSLHADHETNCNHENCPICLVLQIIKTTNNFTGDNTTTSVVLIYLILFTISTFSIIRLTPSTLITQKVKILI